MRALLALMLATGIAHADDKVARAKQLYADGKRLYDVADYPAAIDAWKQAYVLASAPMLLFNIGQAYRLGGDCANALRFYASYEREAPALSNKDELDEARSRCDPHPTNANPPEPTAVAPPPIPSPSSPTPIAVPPPPEPVAAVRPIAEPVHAVVIAPSHHGTVDDGATQRTVGLGVGAAGIALAATSLVLAWRSSAAAHDVETYRGEWGATQEDLQSHGHTLATWSWITGIAGVAAVATGATLFVLGHRHHSITVEATPTGGGVSWSGSF